MVGGRQVERVNTLILGFNIYIPKSLVLSIHIQGHTSIFIACLPPFKKPVVRWYICTWVSLWYVEWYVVLTEAWEISVLQL